MKTSTKIIIAGTTIGVVVAGVLIAKHFINVDKEKQSVQIIGGGRMVRHLYFLQGRFLTTENGQNIHL